MRFALGVASSFLFGIYFLSVLLAVAFIFGILWSMSILSIFALGLRPLFILGLLLRA